MVLAANAGAADALPVADADRVALPIALQDVARRGVARPRLGVERFGDVGRAARGARLSSNGWRAGRLRGEIVGFRRFQAKTGAKPPDPNILLGRRSEIQVSRHSRRRSRRHPPTTASPCAVVVFRWGR